ncbi:MAG: NYN domain-containing protein [Candidatus Omnitrophota bacterium]
MPLQCIIDGYNITNHAAFAPIRNRTKYPQRALFEFIKKRLKGKSPVNRTVIVFDGYPSQPRDVSEDPVIDILFSGEESADTMIKRMVEKSKSAANITVVSDDREIRFFIKSCGARPVSVDEFINPGGSPRKKREEMAKAELNYSQAGRINQELKKLWLKD